jgi:hypothetical protein
VIQNRPNSPKGISAFLQADEQQIQARVIENQANPAAVVPPVSAPESNSSNATVLTLPVILSITGGVFVLAIAGFLVVRRSSKKPEPGLPPPVAFSEPSTPSIPRLAEHDNIFAMPKPAPYEPMFSKPQMDSFVSLPPLDRRTSIYSNQSIGNEKTGLLHRYSDIFTDDVMSDQSNSLNRLPKQDVSHNLANIALRVATDDSSKHTSIFSDSNYSTSTYSQRDSQFTTGTFEFSEVSDYDVFLKAQSMEGSQLADAALQMIRRNREQQRDSQDSLF